MDMSELRFDESHTWVRDEVGVLVGITQYAQDQLGSIIFVELPEAGAEWRRRVFGSIESAKAVEDLIAPISGTITRVNEELRTCPSSSMTTATARDGSSRSIRGRGSGQAHELRRVQRSTWRKKR